MQEVVFLWRGSATAQGAFALTERGGKKHVAVTAGPAPWPRKRASREMEGRARPRMRHQDLAQHPWQSVLGSSH
eukprot:11179099-Lingulodinium_polyedra.AAC.1